MWDPGFSPQQWNDRIPLCDGFVKPTRVTCSKTLTQQQGGHVETWTWVFLIEKMAPLLNDWNWLGIPSIPRCFWASAGADPSIPYSCSSSTHTPLILEWTCLWTWPGGLFFCQWFSSHLTGRVLCGGVGRVYLPLLPTRISTASEQGTKPVLGEILGNVFLHFPRGQHGIQ